MSANAITITNIYKQCTYASIYILTHEIRPNQYPNFKHGQNTFKTLHLAPINSAKVPLKYIRHILSLI